jgi:trehalose 6-phosphate synthase
VSRLLERHPQHRGRLTCLQIAPASRSDVPEYQTLRRELAELTGHINGRHAEPDWTPLRYVNRNFSHDVLTGYYRIARLGLVTPLRDGMNLVAKEFVAAQGDDERGVLVLSQFTGAARELTEALIVNPYDLDSVADAIDAGLAMPLAERIRRWRAMMDTLERQDITHWRRSFLDALASPDD